MTARTRGRRLHTILLSVLLASSAFAVEATPPQLAPEIPRPEALQPQSAKALGCSDEPSFEGWLTSSKTSTTPVTRSTTGNVYAYISDVVDDWSCTSAYRYDGIVWARTSNGSSGNWDWGNLINSTSVSCNWAIGSTDYVKANSTTDCPDSDSEYAMPIYLAYTGALGLLEATFHNDTTPDQYGDFGFIHSDCTSYYGAEPVQYSELFGTSNVGARPGSNCDPYLLESTNTTQSIVVDATAPTFSFTAPSGTAGTITGSGSTSYSVTFNPSDNVAGFGSTHQWKLQRQIADNTGPGTCGAFANDPAAIDQVAGHATYVTGTTQGSQSSSQTLVLGKCYQWVLTGSDMNGNTASAKTSATVIVDSTNPALTFVSPLAGSTLSRNTTSFSVSWTEVEANSGISTRSLQRQKVAATSAACTGTFANDGSAVTTASPSSQTLTSGNCYQWIQTLTDRAGNSVAVTSGKVFVDTSVPMADFSTPNEATTTYQTSTSYSVAWTESAGTGTITARSLKRYRAAFASGDCPTIDLNGAADDTFTGASPNSASLTAGYCYQWVQTLTNSGGKTGSATSGIVVVDTTAPSGSISYPETNRALAGKVTITGSATDAGSFKEYQLEYGAGTSPVSWTSLGTFTSSVTSANLGTWDTSALNGVYTLRLTVRENASASTSVTTHTVFLENSRRGTESFYTRVPFDLGGDWTIDVGVANGEARLSRDVFSIPSYGPEQALSLTYSSLEPGVAGKLGIGWTSNLTQYLTFDVSGGVTVWHRADGGRVPFGLIDSDWTPLRGHWEAMTASGGEVTITTKDQTQYVFEGSGAGRLKRITNRFGKSVTLAWSSGSATATDASGRVTTLTIATSSGTERITAIADSAGRTWTFGYTGTGTSSTLTSFTEPDPDGGGSLPAPATSLTYSSGLLTQVSRARAKVGGSDTIAWGIGYTSGKATSINDPVATTNDTITYSGTSTDVDQIVEDDTSTVARTNYLFDDVGLGRVVTVIDALGDQTLYEFDADSNVTKETTPTEDDGTAVTEYTFDGDTGNLLSQVDPIDASPTNVTTRYTYNATNDVLTRTDADEDDDVRTVTKYDYDGSGHLAKITLNCTSSGTTIPAAGTGGSCSGAGTQNASTNVTTDYTYTANDQVELEQDPLGRVIKHVYDTYGNETSTISNCTTSGTTPPVSFGTCTAAGTHDASTNVTVSSTFDQSTLGGKAGSPTTVTDALGNDTDYTYDGLGRQLTEVLPTDASIPAMTRTSAYDQFGNTLTETDSWTIAGSATTRTTTHRYDLANRETSLEDPAGTDTTTTYDEAGNAVLTTAGGVTTVRTFDLLGRTLEERPVSEDEQATLHEYTTLGALRLTRSATLTTTTQVTTFGGQPTSVVVTPPEGSSDPPIATLHGYDRLGRETSSTDEVGTETTNTYDRLGRLLTTTVDGATTTHAYDRAGNETSLTDPSGVITTTSYDALDRPTTVIANDVASPSGPSEDVTTTTYYDAAGNSVAVVDPSGVTTRTILNTQGQPIETIAHCTDSGTTPPTDPATCTGGGAATATTNVRTSSTYDGSGAALTTTAPTGTQTTAYDADGQVRATIDPMGTVTRYFYDADGRLSETVVDCTSSGTTINIGAGWQDCTGAGTANGTYNLTTSVTYDDHGNKASETGPNGLVTAYRYDTDERLTKTIEKYTDGTPSAGDDFTTETYYDGYGRAVATRHPTADGLTSVVDRTILNDDGTVASEIRNCTESGTTVPADAAAAIACTGAGTKNAETNLITTYTYDDRGNRIRVTAPDPSATSGTSTATVTTQYAFDESDRLCRVVENATGSTDLQALTHPCSDATQTSGTTTTNVSTRYTYDGAGNLVSMIDAAGHTTSYGYDESGRPTSRTDADSGVLVWKYDELGRLIRQENRTDAPMTASVTWTYDGDGRVLTRTADSITTTYTYDANGNKLTATDGTLTITATYDREDRILTVDDEDAGSTADTTYGYSTIGSPTRTDVTGSYGFTLDLFGRPTATNDPVMASDFAATYRADGQPLLITRPDGNYTELTYDKLGHATGSDTDTSSGTGGTDRAVYTWTLNRSGQILTEAATVIGDASNGIVTYTYDPLGRLASSALGGTTTTYGWDTVPNRTSVQVGAGTPATTTYDAADRPTSGANPTASYSNDADGRLTARPGQQLEWDRLGRLKLVKDGSGTLLATYTYDPLDRLRMIDYGAGTRIRFRYVGLTTAVAQWIDDAAGTVTRSVGTGWSGERLLDWTGSGSNIRLYGEDGHHDVTWLASNTGTVSQSLRYDPWGTPRATVPTGYSPFRFQGAYTDDLRDADNSNDLAWVITRWYAPALGRFLSEDSLLGEPIDPPSRNLYAYGQGDPVGTWDPDGRFWYRWLPGDTTAKLAKRFYGSSALKSRIVSGNPGKPFTPVNVRSGAFGFGACIWIPFVRSNHQCQRNHGDSLAPASVLWRRFDGIVRYITHQMRSNSHAGAGGVGIYTGLNPLRDGMTLAVFGLRVAPGGEWDHKQFLQMKYGHNAPFSIAVRDDPAPERLFYDVWSNIHYGYVGRAHGIPAWVLGSAHQLPIAGRTDDADRISVKIGMDLWWLHGRSLSESDVRRAVVAALPRYRATGVKGILRPILLP